MNLLLHLFITTVLGVVSCHEAHAGNFMASSPCFSFQGQNILWPAGPQGMAGISSGSPMSWFNHPFFGGSGCGGSPACKPGVLGAPIEASMPNAPSDHEPVSAPAHAPVVVPVSTPVSVSAPTSVPAASAVPVSTEGHTSVPVPEPAPISDSVAPVTAGDTSPLDLLAHHDEPVHEEPIPVPTTLKENAHQDQPIKTLVSVEPEHETLNQVKPIPLEHNVENKLHPEEAHHEMVKNAVSAPDAEKNLIKPKDTDLHTNPSMRNPQIIAHDDSTSDSDSEEVLPTSLLPAASRVKEEEASLCNMPHDHVPEIPCLNSTNLPDPVHPCNTSCPTHPVINNLPCLQDEFHEVHLPTVDTCNITLPPLVDACNISCHNTSDLNPLSCHGSWHSCEFPGVHPIYNECPPIAYDAGLDCHHGIYSNEILGHQPHVYGDHFYPHHFDGHCFHDPGYETNILPPISFFNLTDPNELNLTDIQNCLPSTAKIIRDPSEFKCARHNIVTQVKPVIDECITCIPVIKNRIKQKEETFTRHIPIVTNHVGTCEENRVCHIPIVNQRTRNVVDHQHHHIPITQSHLVPIVQPYVEQVPVTRQYIRPIVESSVSHVPIVETCVKPVIHHSVNTVPITEKRITPVVHQNIVNIPVREHVPQYGYCGTTPVRSHYSEHVLPATGSAEHLNYPDLPNNYIAESPIDHYGAASNAEPSYSYADQVPASSLIGRASAVEGGVVRHDPEYEQSLSDFRRNLYLPSTSSLGLHQEASLPATSEDISNVRNEEPYGHGEKGYQTGLTEEGPAVDSQDYYQGSTIAREAQPVSSPLSHILPFPQGNAEEVTDRSAGFSRNSDYCD